jgi:phosphohistidine phosphatase
MSDLIIWRHAEAAECSNPLQDHQRKLTARGEKQAARMARWLDRQLPQSTRILVSPAVRAAQTAAVLGRSAKVCPELALGASIGDLLALAQPSKYKGHLLLIGHQPMLGLLIGQLLGINAEQCQIKKGAVWWLRHKDRDPQGRTVLLTVQHPDML